MVFLGKTISGKRARDGQVGRPQSTPLNLEMHIVKYAVDMDACSWVWPHIEEYLCCCSGCGIHIWDSIESIMEMVSGLYQRHPELAKRRVQAFERVRASGMNHERVLQCA